MTRLGIIAGSGLLPITVAEAHITKGGEVIVAGLEGYASANDFQGSTYQEFNLGHAGAIIKYLKSHKVTDLIIAGGAKRPNLSDISVDLKGTILLGKIMAAQFLGDDALLKIVANYIEMQGFSIRSPLDSEAADFIISTKTKPSKTALQSIEYGKKAAESLGNLDIGQAVIVENCLVLGVEAAEGTDKLIERCAEYRKSDGAAVLVKMIKPNQDERIDVPVIGVETVISAHKAKMAGIAIQKGKVIVLDPKNLVETADKYGIFVTTI